jgi:uncharacterized integral membrane protein
MPWRLIGFILLLAFFLVFSVFNLDNTCDISLGFKVIPRVPVYLTALFAFVFGLLWAIPSLVSLRVKMSKIRKKEHLDAPPSPKKRGKKKDKAPVGIESPVQKIDDEPYRKDSPYGID